jgi:thiol-disulfide isomerase/thioredoxin
MLKPVYAVIRISILCVVGWALGGCGDDLGSDQYGQKVSAARVAGQWLIVNYWAEWCAPCRSEVPQLNALAAQLKSQPVKVLGVNYDGLQGEALERASRALGIEFTVLAQDPGKRYQLPTSDALPVTFIIDTEGRLRETLLGEQSAEGLTRRLQALRQEG